jgi:hypothetical protein
MPLLAKNHLSEVIGLKNDIAHKVFSCPNCKTELAISKWQCQGELAITCSRCNLRYQIKGEELREFTVETKFAGLEVFTKGDAAQFAAPVPKDSYLTFVKDGMKWKAATPPPAAPKPATPPAA